MQKIFTIKMAKYLLIYDEAFMEYEVSKKIDIFIELTKYRIEKCDNTTQELFHWRLLLRAFGIFKKWLLKSSTKLEREHKLNKCCFQFFDYLENSTPIKKNDIDYNVFDPEQVKSFQKIETEIAKTKCKACPFLFNEIIKYARLLETFVRKSEKLFSSKKNKNNLKMKKMKEKKEKEILKND